MSRAGDITIAWNGLPAVPDFEALPSAPRRRRLAVLVRLVPHKRMEHALELVAALRHEFPDLHLRVMGSGWWADQLLERAPTSSGSTTRSPSWVTSTDREKFEELSAAAWVHLLPSVKEGWGLSIVEAGPRRRPVGRLPRGRRRARVDPGRRHRAACAIDQDDLVRKVRSLLTDADLRTELGDKARIRAGQFSWDVTAEVIAAALGIRTDDAECGPAVTGPGPGTPPPRR